MSQYCIPLSSSEATDPTRFGPKAANLAALGRAGLRIPDGVCLDAAAYRHQVTSIGLDETARGVFGADDPHQARRHAVNMKLACSSSRSIRPSWSPCSRRGVALSIAQER